MRDSILAVLALALGAFPVILVTAETPTSPAPAARVIDLEECISLGFAHDAGLRSDELETRIADARIREMQGQYLPSLSLQTGYSRLSDVRAGAISTPFSPVPIQLPPSLNDNTSVRLSLQQPLFTGQRITSSIRQAEALRDSSRGDLAASKLDLRYSITEAFWKLAKAKTQVQAISQSVTQSETHLADAKKLLDQGAATNNDVLQAEMRLEDAHIELASARSARDIARSGLAILIGLPWNADFDIPDATALTTAAPIESLQDLVARALSSRPEIQAARSRVTASEASVDVARAGLFPNVFITGDYTIADPNQRIFPQSNQFDWTWSIGILASIDVGRYPQVLAQEEQARNKLAQAQESSHKIADMVTTDVIRAYITLNEAVGRVASLHRETAQAEENDRVTQERYRHGVALSSESLDAQTLLVRARLREDGALFDCAVAKAALERAKGQ